MLDGAGGDIFTCEPSGVGNFKIRLQIPVKDVEADEDIPKKLKSVCIKGRNIFVWYKENFVKDQLPTTLLWCIFENASEERKYIISGETNLTRGDKIKKLFGNGLEQKSGQSLIYFPHPTDAAWVFMAVPREPADEDGKIHNFKPQYVKEQYVPRDGSSRRPSMNVNSLYLNTTNLGVTPAPSAENTPMPCK